MILCVDANVFVAAATAREVHHLDSGELFRRADEAGVHIVSPALMLAEVGSAVVRQSGNADAARQGLAVICQRPGLSLIPLDDTRAQRASDLSITLRLRGADAVYAQVAEEFDAILLTWDLEMLQRTAAAVSAMTPAQWLAAQT